MPEADTTDALGQLRGMTLDVHDLKLTRDFWHAVLGVNITSDSDTWTLFESQSGCAGLSLQKVPEDKVIKNRAHPDVRLADYEAGLAKLKYLGAKYVREVKSGDYRWSIMQDPEGNEFCALS